MCTENALGTFIAKLSTTPPSTKDPKNRSLVATCTGEKKGGYAELAATACAMSISPEREDGLSARHSQSSLLPLLSKVVTTPVVKTVCSPLLRFTEFIKV